MPEFIHMNARDVTAENLKVLADQGYNFDGVTLSGSVVFRKEVRYSVTPVLPPAVTGEKADAQGEQTPA